MKHLSSEPVPESLQPQEAKMSKVITAVESASIGFPLFLTAYDPSDLPGGSLDPLGFERGYLFLSDKILPGLTNVANRPRYFSILCAGASLANVDVSDPLRLQYQRRLECIQRFERFWALANVLASQEADKELPVSGIRGVTYVANKAESILQAGIRRVSADFKMLSRQIPYGVVGIYGAVADGMRLFYRATFTLSPDLGQRLAEGFLAETDVPPMLLKATREDGDIPIDKLAEWGLRAHISGKAFPSEQTCMTEALHRNPIRSRMAAVLADHPFQGPQDTEIQRFKRLLPAISSNASSLDLQEAVSTILAYEVCYQLIMLGFERLLWLCRTLPAASITTSDLNSDPVLKLVCSRLPAVSSQFGKMLDIAHSDQFRIDLKRLDDTRKFLERASASCNSPESLTKEVMARHSDVQRGKFDRGRPKMPWLEVMAERISLTMTRVGGVAKETMIPDDIAPHPYRLASADALITATGGQ